MAAAPSSGQTLEALAAAAAAAAPSAAHASAKRKGPSRTHGGDDDIPMNAAQAGNALLAPGEFYCWVSTCPSNAV